MTFLIDNPNRRYKQYAYPRRGGGYTAPQITLHTYEAPYTRSLLAAATWLTTRADPGSYHALVGHRSARDVLQLAPWSHETWHSVPTNNWSIGISAVMYAHQWKSMPRASVENIVKSMAFASANAAKWLERTHGRKVQPRLLTRAQALRKESGFVHHRITDPGRRTDPANPQSDFPWTMFINEFNRLMKGGNPAPTPERTWLEMASKEDVRELLREANATQNDQLHRAIRSDIVDRTGYAVWSYLNERVEDADAYQILRQIRDQAVNSAGERAGLLEAIKQVSGGSVDLDAIAAAAQKGVADAIDSLEADVTLNLNTTEGA